ncbi:TetR/AcrR family transcriptional regulator [Flavisphingomonas formosensis]|uniref:TetR/AcrR family transcriptional regulator n=1 Tax=Flavisphingomonas formosensis TaxID=861534 RepID=UPI0012FA8CE1|nr:TetR/AcrR family transcriptional regulator [Sphingomonas formosensis]
MTNAAAGAILSRREKNKERTRRAILTAARACFTASGVGATTMDEIAERADVARGTLFNYFPAKADIVVDLIAENNEAFQTLIEEANAAETQVAARLHRIFVGSATRLEANAALSRRLLDPAEQGWAVAAGGDRWSGRLVDAFTAALTTAADRGRVRGDVPARDLGEMLLGLYSGIVLLWRLDEAYPLSAKLEQAARVAVELVMGRGATS